MTRLHASRRSRVNLIMVCGSIIAFSANATLHVGTTNTCCPKGRTTILSWVPPSLSWKPPQYLGVVSSYLEESHCSLMPWFPRCPCWSIMMVSPSGRSSFRWRAYNRLYDIHLMWYVGPSWRQRGELALHLLRWVYALAPNDLFHREGAPLEGPNTALPIGAPRECCGLLSHWRKLCPGMQRSCFHSYGSLGHWYAMPHMLSLSPWRAGPLLGPSSGNPRSLDDDTTCP